VSRNRIELVGFVLAVPVLRTTPAGTPVLRIEISSGDGPDTLRLGIVMAGGKAAEVGGRIAAGATIQVIGKLRPSRERKTPLKGYGVEVLADEIVEVAPGAASL
jgi:primosomal replication protein N